MERRKMSSVIDYDNPDTFPKALQELDINFKNMILSRISLEGASEWWRIEDHLHDLHIEEGDIVKRFVEENMDTEVAVYHCTRILDVNEYWNKGIVTGGGKNSVGEERIRKLLCYIKLTDEQIEEVFTHIYALWDRDKTSRTEAVHFFY